MKQMQATILDFGYYALYSHSNGCEVRLFYQSVGSFSSPVDQGFTIIRQNCEYDDMK